MTKFVEPTVEAAALDWLETEGWSIAHGPHIVPDLPAAGRTDYGGVVLAQRPRDALLPTLISGELRGNDAGRFVAKASE